MQVEMEIAVLEIILKCLYCWGFLVALRNVMHCLDKGLLLPNLVTHFDKI